MINLGIKTQVAFKQKVNSIILTLKTDNLNNLLLLFLFLPLNLIFTVNFFLSVKKSYFTQYGIDLFNSATKMQVDGSTSTCYSVQTTDSFVMKLNETQPWDCATNIVVCIFIWWTLLLFILVLFMRHQNQCQFFCYLTTCVMVYCYL